MVDFLPSRPMEDFFVNPTLMMDQTRHKSMIMTLDDNFLYNPSAPESLHLASAISRSPSLQDNAAMAELRRKARFPSHWQGYTSDEELPSPVDNDHSSLHSSRTPESVAISRSNPERLVDNYDAVEQQCRQAQAVQILSAGKARIISLPRPITIPARRHFARAVSGGTTTTTHEKRRPSTPRMHSVDESVNVRSSHESSGDDSLSSEGAASPASTAPSSIYDSPIENAHHKKTFSRHVPLMEAAAASPTTPMFARSVHIFKREGAKQPVVPTSPVQPPLRRMTNKISTNFGISRKEVPKREAGSDAQQMYAQSRPSTRGSMSSRMIARGANEREPPISLPPFPFRRAGSAAQGQSQARNEFQPNMMSAV